MPTTDIELGPGLRRPAGEAPPAASTAPAPVAKKAPAKKKAAAKAAAKKAATKARTRPMSPAEEAAAKAAAEADFEARRAARAAAKGAPAMKAPAPVAAPGGQATTPPGGAKRPDTPAAAAPPPPTPSPAPEVEPEAPKPPPKLSHEEERRLLNRGVKCTLDASKKREEAQVFTARRTGIFIKLRDGGVPVDVIADTWGISRQALERAAKDAERTD